MGGSSYNTGSDITTDDNGNVYTLGYFQGTVDFDPGTGTTNLTSAGGFDIFIQKLDANGNFVWVQQIGGTISDYGVELTIDAVGNMYTTGYFRGTVDFDPSVGISNLIAVGNRDIFIQKLGASNVIAIPTIASNTTKLYPNPSTSAVTIELDQAQEATITILNNQGQLVHPPLLIQQQQISLELEHLPIGIYYTSVTTLKNTTVSKWSKL